MTDTPRKSRPFLKWAGGKYAIVDAIRARLPEGRRLVEPFVGSGAAFLNLDYPAYRLSDNNGDLISLFRILRDEGDDFIARCRALFCEENNSAERYYALRDEFNGDPTPRRRAALFLYLNRYGFNGLCRYNKRGGFNVPFGSYRRPYFPEREMRYFCEHARHAEFVQEDFVEAMRKAQPGDVVYCDPPYVPLSETAYFTAYSRGGFGPEQQTRLADEARACAERGIPVLISNHATDITRALYRDAERVELEVQRTISCDGANRARVAELLALFTP